MEKHVMKLEELGFEFNDNTVQLKISNKMSDLEKKYEIGLPKIYKETISLVGGQYPEYDFALPVEEKHPYFGEKNTTSFIDFINPIGDSFDSLESQWVEYSSRMPIEIVPIINSNGGDYICLGVEGTYIGNIYYWIRGLEVDENFQKNGWNAVFLVANSFEEFLDRIVVFDN